MVQLISTETGTTTNWVLVICSSFNVGDESTGYTLSLSGCTGTAGADF